MPNTILKRDILSEIKAHLSHKEITLIVGPRQAGKTTLMLLLKDDLEKDNQKTLFFNLDIEPDRQIFSGQETLVKKIEMEIGKNSGYVFIDEIQRKENAGLFLKGLYDMRLPYKFIVSASGSLELKEKIHESLAGRKRIFELSTLSFKEFADFKTDYKYGLRLKEFFEVDHLRAMRIFEEYLNFGGYPRVVLAETSKEKQKMIDEIYRSYLERDIFYFWGVEKEEAFVNLVRLLSRQIGGLVSVSELSSALRLSAKTVQKYLWYLQKTFVLL